MNKPDNQQPDEAVKPIAPVTKPAEAVKPVPSEEKPTEAAKPVAPAAKPVEAAKPAVPETKPVEAAKPAVPETKPVEAAKPVAPAAKPVEAAKPVALAAKPVEAAKPAVPETKPVEAAKPAAPEAKPVEAAKPAAPAAKPVEAAKPAAPEAKPVEAAKPAAPAAKPVEAAKPAAPAAKPVEAAKTAAPAAKPVDTAKPVAPAAKPVEAAKPAAPEAKPVDAAKPVAPAAKPVEAAKPAAPVAKPVDAVKPAVKPVTSAAKQAEAKAGKRQKGQEQLKAKLGRLGGLMKHHRLLLLLVWLPLAVAALYLGVLAKDRYVSESMVVVKRADDMNIGNLSLGSLLTGGGASTKEDALLLQQYIMSPDMLQKLDAKLDFKTAFANSGWDLLQRLPKNASFEDYLAYYQDKVAVVFDEKNAVLHITTQGFDAEFAQQFNQAVLAESERFINELSHKINREEMLFANQEINRSYGQLQEAKETLLAFQNENNLVDPQVQIEATSRIVAELQTKQAQLEAELTNQLTYLNDDTPQIKAARSAITSIQQQIEKERSTLTSSDNEQLNQKMFEFEELKAKVAFEGDLYKLSLAALEKSRVEAARKAKSLATISQPYLAEDARYPRRWYQLLTVFLVSLLVYGLSKVTLSIIEDHKI